MLLDKGFCVSGRHNWLDMLIKLLLHGVGIRKSERFYPLQHEIEYAHADHPLCSCSKLTQEQLETCINCCSATMHRES